MIMGYIDPGSGSVMLQLIVGGVIGGMFAVKCYWRCIRDFAVGVLHWSRQVMFNGRVEKMKINNKYKHKTQRTEKITSPLVPKANPGHAYVRNEGNHDGWFNLYRMVINSHAAVNHR